MKRGSLLVSLLLSILIIGGISATCELVPVLINQDPNPAVPGEEVKVLFQLRGVENSDCGKVSFELVEKYPFTIDPSTPKKVEIDSGTYQKDYNSFLMIPYKLRIDRDVLDGDAELKINYKAENQALTTKTFNLTIEDVLADFVVTIDSYSYETKRLTLAIINIGQSNIQSATLEISQQDTIDIYGSHVKIIGDLDSNEDTTISFDALPKDGNIKVILSYNDETNQRRIVEKNILFSEVPYANTKAKNGGMSTSAKLLLLTWLVIIGYFIYSKRKAKKLLQKQKLFRR